MEPAFSRDELLRVIRSGQDLLVFGEPGSGKTELLKQAFARLVEGAGSEAVPPVLFLTPDRRRADQTETALGPRLLGTMRAPGGHRLVRGVNSFAYQVVSQWLLERDQPRLRPVLTGGADEDIWVSQWLEDNAAEWASVFPPEAAQSDALRMEVRNGMARSGERGLGPEDVAHIAETADVPAWRMLAAAYADYAGENGVAFTTETPHLDSARIQVIAAQTLRDWEESGARQGVQCAPPAPRVVLVDDLQDCTPATAHLLAALSAAGSQIVAACSQVSYTGAYRGAGPQTAHGLEQLLELRKAHLGPSHRATGTDRALLEAASAWVDPSRKAPEPAPKARPVIVSGDGRRGAWIAQQIRKHHLLDGVEWEEQAVVVRSAADIEPLRRQLARAGVPLAPTERSLQFSQVPVTRALLELLEEDPTRSDGSAAMKLLSSPLANVDRLALYRFLREHGDPAVGYEDQILAWLRNPPDKLAEELGAAANQVQTQLQRAGRIWSKRASAAVLSPQMGLWELWEAADVAEGWKTRALAGHADSERADDRLDAVLALFRRADLWEQQQMLDPSSPPADGRTFAAEMLAQSVASDSIARAGARGPGVEILTVTQAAGRHWRGVYVTGLQDGLWPARSRPSGVLEIPRLEQVLRAIPLAPIGTPGRLASGLDANVLRMTLDEREYRLSRRREEAALFVAAVSRTTEHLYLVAAENEHQAASPFLNYLASQGVLEQFRDEDDSIRYTQVPPAFDIETYTGLLRRATVDADKAEGERRQAASLLALMARGGVQAADPLHWVGAGGLTSNSPLLGSRGQLRIGPSSLQTGTDCLLQWFYRTIQGEDRPGILQPEELGPAEIGNLIHDLAERYPQGDEDALRDAFQEQWEALGLDDETWVVQRQRANLERMVLNMGVYFRGAEGPVQVEQPITLDLGQVALSGRIDRLEEQPDGSVRIVDIKTTRTTPSKTQVDENLQLAAYQLALRNYKTIDQAALLLVNPDAAGRNPLRSQPALSDEEAERLQADLSDLGQAMLGPTYQVRPVPACQTCRFKAVCPVQDQGVRSVQ